VYVRPDPDVIRLGKNELLKVLQPLYGLADAGDYWSRTLTRFHLTELSMERATGDFALFFRGIADPLVGISTTCVGDILQAGTKVFRRDALAALHKNFDTKPAENPPLTFAGIHIRTKAHAIGQTAYIDRQQKLPQSASFVYFRSQGAKMAWICHTRPELSCAISLAVQVTQKTYTVWDVRSLNVTVRYLKQIRSVGLQFPRLDMEKLKLVVYSDASFRNRKDGSSLLGDVIALSDDTWRAAILA
jgi:hypothetical protein